MHRLLRGRHRLYRDDTVAARVQCGITLWRAVRLGAVLGERRLSVVVMRMAALSLVAWAMWVCSRAVASSVVLLKALAGIRITLLVLWRTLARLTLLVGGKILRRTAVALWRLKHRSRTVLLALRLRLPAVLEVWGSTGSLESCALLLRAVLIALRIALLVTLVAALVRLPGLTWLRSLVSWRRCIPRYHHTAAPPALGRRVPVEESALVREAWRVKCKHGRLVCKILHTS